MEYLAELAQFKTTRTSELKEKNAIRRDSEQFSRPQYFENTHIST